MPLFKTITILLTTILFACYNSKHTPNNQVLSTAVQHNKLSGWWQSDGYGYLIHLGANKNRFFQLSGQFCLEEDIGNETLHDFYPRYRINEMGDQVEFYGNHDLYPYRYRRLNKAPESCVQKIPNTPLNNFAVFVDLFTTHYAFFDLYGIDWDARVAQFRPQVNVQTTDHELFNIFESMLAGINDGHISVKADIAGKATRFNANPGLIDTALKKYAAKNQISLNETSNQFHNHYWLKEIPAQVLAQKGSFAGNKRIQYGLIEQPDSARPVGYLALVSVANFLEPDSQFTTLTEALDSAMDQAISLFTQNNVKAAIIDLSINYGGYDFISRKIAERFSANQTQTYGKYADDATQPAVHRFELKANSELRYTGPVYVMTSNITVSGGEILTMSLKSLPNVTHVGEPTRGALSDKLEKTLPNGWELSLSNEVYIDHQGNQWEGQGIQPDVTFSVFDWDNPMDGHIKAVDRLVKLIHNNSNRYDE